MPQICGGTQQSSHEPLFRPAAPRDAVCVCGGGGGIEGKRRRQGERGKVKTKRVAVVEI